MISTSRIRGILADPRREWPVIAAEPTTPAALYRGWIIPLAAIGPIASFIGFTVFGISLPFMGRYRVPIASALTGSIVRYACALAGVYLLALVIDKLAPSFGGQSDRLQALKVAAYSSTAAWLAGIFGLFPPIAFLGLLGLYSIYLLYLGLPALMKSPPERAAGYTAVVVVVAIIVFVVIGAVSGLLLRTGRYPR
jgi:Yip1 domain